jgi:hypothetical protein
LPSLVPNTILIEELGHLILLSVGIMCIACRLIFFCIIAVLSGFRVSPFYFSICLFRWVSNQPRNLICVCALILLSLEFIELSVFQFWRLLVLCLVFARLNVTLCLSIITKNI